MRLHSEYILLTDIVLATPSTVFQDKRHFEFGIVPGDGVNLLWLGAIGTIRGRYFILTRQKLDAETAKEWGAVNEIVPADKLLARAREIAEGLADVVLRDHDSSDDNVHMAELSCPLCKLAMCVFIPDVRAE